MLPMAAIMFLTVVVLAAAGALLSVRATKARIATQIDDVAQILKESNFPLTDAVLRQMKGLSGAEMSVVDQDGLILATSGSARMFAPLLVDSTQAQSKSVAIGDRLWRRNQGFFHTVVPLSARRGSDGGGKLHIFFPEHEYRRAWQRAIYPSFVFTLLALPVVVLLSKATAARISQRMSRLQSQVDQIARGDFQQITLSERDDEISALGAAVNEMAEKLARYQDDVRRTERMRTLAHLGGGIAHQLRNSATGCRIAIDLHADECPTAIGCESLAVAKQQLRLMEEYIQRFLQLGRPASNEDSAPIDLAAMIDQLLPLVQPAARHARVAIQWRPPGDSLVVHGEAAALSQLVINLLINAIEAASGESVRLDAPGQVVIGLMRHESDCAILTVSDTGPGPPSEIADELFEPFVTGKPDGVGIGLSVAHEVVARHGGRIYWQRVDGMTQFVVELPIEGAASRAAPADSNADAGRARLAGLTVSPNEQELQLA
jgi:signal transduction histidine kinase